MIAGSRSALTTATCATDSTQPRSVLVEPIEDVQLLQVDALDADLVVQRAVRGLDEHLVFVEERGRKTQVAVRVGNHHLEPTAGDREDRGVHGDGRARVVLGRNPNLDFVIRDAADTVAALRAEGKTVFLHCFEGRSRTPAVGAAYSVLHRGRPADIALREVTAALPEGAPQRFLQETVRRLVAD